MISRHLTAALLLTSGLAAPALAQDSAIEKAMQQIDAPKDIYPVFRELFRKRVR